MSAVASAKLLAAGAGWRLAGVPAAGRTLLRAAGGGRESERTLAGMLLVQAGDRSVPVLAEALLDGSGPAELVPVLASIGTPAARGALTRLSGAGPPPVAVAAADALRALDAQG